MVDDVAPFVGLIIRDAERGKHSCPSCCLYPGRGWSNPCPYSEACSEIIGGNRYWARPEVPPAAAPLQTVGVAWIGTVVSPRVYRTLDEAQDWVESRSPGEWWHSTQVYMQPAEPPARWELLSKGTCLQQGDEAYDKRNGQWRVITPIAYDSEIQSGIPYRRRIKD